MMRKTKRMLMGIMLCGAMALAGGVATLNAYENDAIRTYAVEASSFSETATKVTGVHLRSKRLLLFLDTCDYTSTGGTTVVQASYADYNTLDMIQVYVGDTCVTLREALATSGDTNVYYNVWGENKSISFQLNGDSYTASNVTKIVIPVGTQFPAYSYTNEGGSAVAYTANGTYTITNNDFSNPDWSTNWSVSVEYPPVEFTEIETDVTIHRWDNGNHRLMFKVAGGDHASANNNTSLSADVYKDLGTFDGILLNGTPISSMDGLNDCHIKLYGEGDVTIGKLSFVAGDIVTIKAGTKFPSYSYVSGGKATCYKTKEDMSWVFNPTDISYETFNWLRCDFESASTSVAAVGYDNGRLAIKLTNSDYENAANNTFTFQEGEIVALNTLKKITVNDVALADLWNGDVAFMHMWGMPGLWIPMSAPAEGDLVRVPAGTQLPTYAYLSSGTLTCYETTEEIEYVYANGAWKHACKEYTSATCTQAAVCVVCGAENGTALGHSYNEVVTDPTCTTDGYTTYTCETCGDSYVDDTVSAHGHSYAGVVTEPTCTTDGYTTYTCETCGDSYVGDTVTASGHSFADGACGVCGEADPDYVPPVSEEPETPVESEEPEQPAVSEEPEVPATSEKPADSEGKKDKKGGCGSSVALGMVGALTAVGAALVIKKRKED